MSIVKFTRIISCSSEDPKHPVNNLLESQVGKCWKCKTPGEKQIVVILQLEKNCRIHSIDIGNENSAFIEIFVGRSAVPDQYEILRVASLLMSIAEAKKGDNRNAVRFFKEEDFSKPAVDESWDRIKITCTQPFNKLAQYGLSFVKVRTKDATQNDSTPLSDSTSEKNSLKVSSPSRNSALGKFKLKQDSKDSNEVPIGSFFAKRNEKKDELPSTAAAAIRAASSNPEPTIKRLSDLLPGFKDAKKARKNDTEAAPPKADGRRSTTGRVLYEDALSDEETESKAPLRVSRNADVSKKKKPEEGPLVYRELSDEEIETRDRRNKENSTPNSRPKRSPPKQQTPQVQRKPFNRLLEGVVFVISGYQNPYRSELRSKALSMGAKYKADWDSSCTHLICAFPNTPKANAVRGKGWIIRKEWIEDCYNQRKRLLSQNYRMNKKDTSTFGNDEEIHEEIPDQTSTSPKRVNNRTSDAAPSSSHKQKKCKEETDVENIYDAETDVDSEDESNYARITRDYESIDLEVLPDFLSDRKIYIGADISRKLSDMLERYIIAFKGEVASDIDDAHYIISEDARYKENVGNLPVLLPDWVWECTDQRKLVDISDFSL